MNRIEAYGYIKDGVLHILGRRRMDTDIKQLKNGDVRITIQRKGKRSTPANNYYWGIVLVEIRAELLRLGQIRQDVTTKDLHHAFKLKFNPERTINEETGEVLLEVGGSTTAMNKDAFSLYLDKIIEWSTNSLGLSIPPPNTQAEMFAETRKP